MSSRLPAVAALVLALMAVTSCVEIAVFGLKKKSVAGERLPGVPSLATIGISGEIHGWQHFPEGGRSGFLENLSLDHRVWLFRKGSRRAWIAADLPYPTIHRLPVCYSNRDWHVLRHESPSYPGLSPFTVMALRAKDGNVAPMMVIYDNYDLRNRRFANGAPSRLKGRWEQTMNRLKGRPGGDRADQGPFCQIQLVLEGSDSLDSQIGQDALRLFDAARNELAGRFAGEINQGESE